MVHVHHRGPQPQTRRPKQRVHPVPHFDVVPPSLVGRGVESGVGRVVNHSCQFLQSIFGDGHHDFWFGAHVGHRGRELIE